MSDQQIDPGIGDAAGVLASLEPRVVCLFLFDHAPAAPPPAALP